MPEITRFFDAERFYATKFHELAHSCEVPKRLNIDHGGPKSFGNESYARGELLAECTAAILGATLGFRPDHLEDHAGYIGSWLKALRNDKRFILKAAADAQRGGRLSAGRRGSRKQRRCQRWRRTWASLPTL
jgi:antirestriction protein ArdC